MKILKYPVLLTMGLLFVGCNNQPQPNCGTTTKITPKPATIQNSVKNKKENLCFIKNGVPKCILRIEASGVGVVPCNGACSIAQAKAMARRAAIVSAYRNLAEKLYGIKINGRDSVKNMILQSSTIRAYVTGLIRGAIIEDENFKEGTYTVILSLKLDPVRWNRVLKEAGLLSIN